MATIFSTQDVGSQAYALAEAYNQLHDAISALGIGATGATGVSPSGFYFHRDVTAAQATGTNYKFPRTVPMVVNPFPTGTSAPTGLANTYVVALDLQGKLLAHFRDDSSHTLPDVVNATGLAAVPAPISPLDATGIPFLLNQCRTFFNAHLTQSCTGPLNGLPYGAIGNYPVHVVNDTVNTVNTATATSTGTSYTIAGALASGVSAHIANGPSYGRIKLIPA